MFKIVVGSQVEKDQLIEASRHIHDSDVDTDLPMVNTLAHLYLAPDLIVVADCDSEV